MLYLFFLAVLQAALSAWWLWISDGGGDQFVSKELGYLILVSGPAAFRSWPVWLMFAICAVVLFALLIAAATVRHRSARPVFVTFAVLWYAFCGLLPALMLI